MSDLTERVKQAQTLGTDYVNDVIFRYPLEKKFDEAINKAVTSIINTVLQEGIDGKRNESL